jgi:hypothetical protein
VDPVGVRYGVGVCFGEGIRGVGFRNIGLHCPCCKAGMGCEEGAFGSRDFLRVALSEGLDPGWSLRVYFFLGRGSSSDCCVMFVNA